MISRSWRYFSNDIDNVTARRTLYFYGAGLSGLGWAGWAGLGWAGLGVFAKTEQFDKWSDGAVTTHRTRSNYTATVQIFLQCLPIVHNRQILIFLPLTDCNLVSFIMFLLLIHRYLTGGQMYRLQLTKHLTRPTGVKPTVQCNVDNS